MIMQNEERRVLAEKFRQRIDELQQLLEEHAPEDAGKSGKESNDDDRRLDELASRTVDAALLNKARRDLAAIFDNLEQLDDPDFGCCETCGRTIPVERLLLVPTTQLCVECARSNESG